MKNILLVGASSKVSVDLIEKYSDDYNFDSHWSKGYHEKYGINPIYLLKHLYLTEGGSGVLHNSIGYVYLNIVLRYLGDLLGGYHTLNSRFLNMLFLFLIANYSAKISFHFWRNEKVFKIIKWTIFLYPIMLFNSVHVFRDTLVCLILVYSFYGCLKYKKNVFFILFNLLLIFFLFYLRKANCLILIFTNILLYISDEKLRKNIYFSLFIFLIFLSILLIFYGENNLFTTVGGTKDEGSGGSARTIKEGNTIRGGPKSLNIKDMKDKDSHFYEYPSYSKMRQANLKLVYLGHYIEDWYAHKNAKIAIDKGLETRKDKPWEMGDLWGHSALDEDFRIVNQYLRYLKLGHGQVTDQVCELIHQKMMTREEAVEKVTQYDGRCDDRYIEKVCKFFDITNKQFYNVVSNFVNRSLFENINGKWLPKFKPQ
mgnify:CR=1 FL=1